VLRKFKVKDMKIKFYSDNEKIIAGMTLRDEKEREGGNMALHACRSHKDVLINRNKVSTILGCGLDSFVCLNQTHSSNYLQAVPSDGGKGAMCLETAIPDADAVFTFEPNLLLCCFSADCVPVLFFHEMVGLVGAIHSGWQGTVKEITLKVFTHLVQSADCDPKGFKVYIGKSISKDRFEVDEDVYRRFKDLGYPDQFIDYRKNEGKYHIDNRLVVREQCVMSGISPENIFVDASCTFQDSDCFSYRQDRSCGRHMGFIMRRE
jgi:YfiH family protein